MRWEPHLLPQARGSGDLRPKWLAIQRIQVPNIDTNSANIASTYGYGFKIDALRTTDYTWNWSWLEKAQDTAQDAQTQTLRPYITRAIPRLQVYMCSQPWLFSVVNLVTHGISFLVPVFQVY